MFSKNLVIIGLLLATTSQIHATIIVNGGKLYSESQSGNGVENQVLTLPTSNLSTSTTSISGTSTSHTSYNFTTSATENYASYREDFEHHRSGLSAMTRPGGADSYLFLAFTLDQETSYEILGSYQSSQIGNINSRIQLYRGATGYFSNEQTSKETANELFTVGESGGDFSNILTGSSSGLLGPGTYSILGSFGISALGADAGADAHGFFQLTLGAPSPIGSTVPEPGALALMGFCLAALAFAGRKRSQARPKSSIN